MTPLRITRDQHVNEKPDMLMYPTNMLIKADQAGFKVVGGVFESGSWETDKIRLYVLSKSNMT